jgi:RHS repeat-associated protein
MQLASSARIPDGFMAAMRLGGEKPHQGLPGLNPALYQGPTVCNSTTALGLQAAAVLNRIGSRSTGKERDTESGNDYFMARYYSSTMGRFMSPDWSAKQEPVPYAKLDNPQSLNLYVYVLNNPLLHIDADGHVCGGPGDPCPSTTGALNKQINAAIKPPAEDFTNIGGTDANFNHINYSIKSGEVSQYTHVDGDLPNVKDLGSGYSGKGAGLNNPSMESVPGAKGKPDAGPIPEGKYTIGKQQDNVTGSGTKLAASERLTPSAGNDMHGRGGFLIHGDNSSHNNSASEGCIVTDRSVRDAIGNSGDKTLTVTQ